jgi:integrase
MLRKAGRLKPSKPYKDFPLTAHPNGQWCKKIRGRVHYFGPWEDWEGSLQLYKEQRDDLQAGLVPRKPAENEPTLGALIDSFLKAKQVDVATGEITQRSYDDYERTAEKVKAALKSHRRLDDIRPDDLSALKASLGRGKSLTTLKGELTRARMIFNFANENGLANVRYKKPLKSPSQRKLREIENNRGPRMFEPAELRAIIKAADDQLRAMVLLGINCAFGNHDCGSLPISAVDLDSGWHHYWRPKTQNPRRCPLWPETVKALNRVVGDRDSGLVFITKYGNPWSQAETNRDNPISFEFRKLLVTLGIYRKNVTTFYSLRRTFETIAATTGEQVAVDHIMGHVAASDDMAAVYRQKTFDGPLLKVSNHVRGWMLGKIKLV